MTQIFAKKIVHFGPGPDGNTIVDGHMDVHKQSDSPFYNVPRTEYPWWPVSCAKMTVLKRDCRPPYLDHSHFTGEKKPWKFAKPTDLWDEEAPKADVYLWWRTIEKLQKEGFNIEFKAGTKEYGKKEAASEDR